MRILVTNDDGVFAPGLLALARAMRSLGEVWVIAPDHNWSASGHVKTLHRPLRVREVELADGTTTYSSDGAPSDCVALGLMGLLPGEVDLVVSGINPNSNLGHDVTYSGTVTAAMEAAISGKPAIAFSLESPEDLSEPIDFSAAERVAEQVAAEIIRHDLPPGFLANVNIPCLPLEQIKGIKITRQGLRIYHDELVRRLDPRGVPYYWIGGGVPTGVPEEGTDIGAVNSGYVSITPLKLDLTAHDQIDLLKGWKWQDITP